MEPRPAVPPYPHASASPREAEIGARPATYQTRAAAYLAWLLLADRRLHDRWVAAPRLVGR